MRISRIAAIALAVTAAATGLACGGAGTPDGPTRPPVIIETTKTPIDPTTEATTKPTGPETTPPVVPPAAKPVSASQANANRMAYSYLANQSFSRSGLIDQLTYEGFTKAEATHATDVGIGLSNSSWNEQAELHAKSYLENQSFSKKGLIEQLEYDGFTPAQAKYGVSKTGL